MVCYQNSSIVEISKKFKYICVILQSNWSLKQACDDLCAGAREAYFALMRKLPFDSMPSSADL